MEMIYYSDTDFIYALQIEANNNSKYWYIHYGKCQTEIDIFKFDDSRGFRTLPSLEKYILKQIKKQSREMYKFCNNKLKQGN